MRGASRASLAEATDRLSAVMAGSPAAGQLGDELFAVVSLLDSQQALRRALADSASARDARSGLAAAVLGARVSASAAELVSSVVTQTWSSPADLVDALEQLAVLAVVTIADRDGHLDDLEDDLFRFARIVGGQPELRAALGNPFAPAQAKEQLVSTLLAGRATPEAVQLVTRASLHPRGRSLDGNLEDCAALAARYRERLVAEVRVATELSAVQRRRLAAALAAAYGHQVHLNMVLDPQVIGGMIIRVGGEQIDASVASRLAELRRRLAA
ncbi:MAG TPA: F0F1 ATP synthase subunit delta [Streptosporangiaceae bacterium]|nr:F0F1 ATP synthase subunit delta [Streptosporangiaceae bacterium]